jgi:hypothetical protein
MTIQNMMVTTRKSLVHKPVKMCCHMPFVAKWYFSPLQRAEALSLTIVSFLRDGEGCVDLRRGELPSTLCSFTILEIEKIRKKKSFIRLKVGDGCRVFLWFDQWHLARYLLDNFGFRVVYDSGLPLTSKLDAIIKNGDWYWSHARSDALVEIQSKLHEMEIGGVDMPVWNSRS